MTVEIRGTQGGAPVSYQNVIALAMDENGISIIQDTGTKRLTQAFEVGYSATVII